MKIAIVGEAETTCHQAPFDDPEWKIWTLNDAHVHGWRWDEWFQIDRLTNDGFGENPKVSIEDHVGWLSEQTKPVYLMYPDARIPNALPYPRDAMLRKYPSAFLSSSPAWMLALAIERQPLTIGVWGCDCAHGTEYDNQRWGLWFFEHEAKRQDIAFFFARGSALNNRPLPYPEVRSERAYLDARVKLLSTKLEEAQAKLGEVDRALMFCMGQQEAGKDREDALKALKRDKRNLQDLCVHLLGALNEAKTLGDNVIR